MLAFDMETIRLNGENERIGDEIGGDKRRKGMKKSNSFFFVLNYLCSHFSEALHLCEMF